MGSVDRNVVQLPMNHQSSNESVKKKQLDRKGGKPFRALSPPNPHLIPSTLLPFTLQPPKTTMNPIQDNGFYTTNNSIEPADFEIPLPRHPYADILGGSTAQGAGGMDEELSAGTKALTPHQQELCGLLVQRGQEIHGGNPFIVNFDRANPMQELTAIEDALPNEILNDSTDRTVEAASGFAETLASDTTEVDQPSTSSATTSTNPLYDRFESLDSEDGTSATPVEAQSEVPVQLKPEQVCFKAFRIQVPKSSQAEELVLLDPNFVPSQYVFEHKGIKPFTEIKVNKTVQLKLTSEPMVHQWVFVGLFHSHPDYAEFPIVNHQAAAADPNLKTPFNVHTPKSNCLMYSEVRIGDHNIPIHGAFVLLQNENEINLDFNVNSTDKLNHGGKKEGKEWFQDFIPLSSERVEELFNESSVLTVEDLLHHSIIRVQVREEIRRSQLAKPRSSIEINFALTPCIKKRRLESQIMQAKLKKMKAELRQMNIQQLKVVAKEMDLNLA